MDFNYNDLKKRHRIEEEFHDTKGKKESKATSLMGHTNYAINELIKMIGDYRGKKILEVGCGRDGLSIYLGRRGAITDGFDISEECINQGIQLIKQFGIEKNVTLKKNTAEEMNYPDECFDYVIGNAVLHHCDLGITLKQINRVLKKGGKGFFIEPLDHNIFLKIYRIFTPNLRSPAEKPFEFSDFSVFEREFNTFKHREMFLLSLFCFVLYGISRSKKIFTKSFNILNAIDETLLKLLPFLRKYCWMVIFSFKK